MSYGGRWSNDYGYFDGKHKYSVFAADEDEWVLLNCSDWGGWIVRPKETDGAPLDPEQTHVLFTGKGAEQMAVRMWHDLNSHEVTGFCELCESPATHELGDADGDVFGLCYGHYEQATEWYRVATGGQL